MESLPGATLSQPVQLSALDLAVLEARDPTTNKRLSDPVVIFPCCCTVNYETVEKVEVVAKKGMFKVSRDTPCPNCKKKMRAYCKDKRKREYVEKLLYQVDKDRNRLNIDPEPILRTELAYPLNIDPEPILRTELAYPQPAGEFFISDFEKKFIPSHFVWAFESKNDSVVKRIVFTGDKRKEVKLFLKFQPEKDFQNYLASQGFYLTNYDHTHHEYQAEEPEKMRKLFRLLVENNKFPIEYVHAIQSILSDM